MALMGGMNFGDAAVAWKTGSNDAVEHPTGAAGPSVSYLWDQCNPWFHPVVVRVADSHVMNQDESATRPTDLTGSVAERFCLLTTFSPRLPQKQGA